MIASCERELKILRSVFLVCPWSWDEWVSVDGSSERRAEQNFSCFLTQLGLDTTLAASLRTNE